MRIITATLLLSVLSLVGCITAKHEIEVKDPIRVQVDPIFITLDVNIRVEKKVDEAFDFLYEDDNGGK